MPGVADGDQVAVPLGKQSQYDDYAMRRAAISYKIPYITTLSAASAATDAILALRSRVRSVRSVQERIADGKLSADSRQPSVTGD